MYFKSTIVSFISLLLLMLPISANAIDIQGEAMVQRLITSLETENYQKAYEILQGLKETGEITGELLYYEALAALSTKRDFEALEQITKYIEKNGKGAKHYSRAIEIYSAASENVDRKLAINSIENWYASSAELYIENRMTSLWRDFYKLRVEEHKSFNSRYIDNKDGTISVYRLVKSGSNSANLYKFEAYACPIGSNYKEGACVGKPDKFQSLSESKIREIFEGLSLAGHRDWRIPRRLFVSWGGDYFSVSDFFTISPDITYFDGQNYAETHVSVSTNTIHPQAYLFNDHGLNEYSDTQKNTGVTGQEKYQIPQFGFAFLDEVNSNNSKQYCVVSRANTLRCDVATSYMVIPVRGPELVGKDLPVTQCEAQSLNCLKLNHDGNVIRFDASKYHHAKEHEYFLELANG